MHPRDNGSSLLRGNDKLYSIKGSNTLDDGAGKVLFIFKEDNDHDPVKDFKIGEDKLSLNEIAGVEGYKYLTITNNDEGNAVIIWNTNDSIMLEGYIPGETHQG